VGTPPNRDPLDPQPAPNAGEAAAENPAESTGGLPAEPAAGATSSPPEADISHHDAAPASPSEADSDAAEAQAAAGAALHPTEAAAPSEPGGWTGRVIDDRYRVVRLLGEGGMGAVFTAEHLTLHKKVALKVVRAELAGNGEVAARFAREAMATAQFEHPHVASAIDYGTLPEGGAYFVMQLVRGRSLRWLMSGEKKLPWRRACEIAAQVADALSAAKAAGIIHRDLKPDNILVERREDGSDLVKVLDFGIAHIQPRDAAAPAGAQAHRALTRVGTVMGTPGYMSPEQAVGDKVDHRTDLYALGVVLWETIAGRELWDAPDLTSVVTRQMTEAVPKLRELVDDPTLPAEVDELLQRLLARNVVERPEHAAEVRDTLRRLAHASAPAFSPQLALHALDKLRESSVGPWIRSAIERYGAQPPRTRKLQAGGAAVAALSLVMILAATGDDTKAAAPAGQEQSPAAEAATNAKTEAEAKAGTETKAEKPSMIEKVVLAAADAVQKAAPKPKAPPPYPAELEEDVKTLFEADAYRDRRAAADKIHAYVPAENIATYVRVVAELERARGCKPRKVAIGKMRTQPDARFLPTLQRYARASRSGCGFLSLSDCYACIRGDLRRAIDANQANLPPPEGE
jgi:eukaryotic-like serine/threonine-protein kinase